MDVIFSNEVKIALELYRQSLSNYPISIERAIEKFDNMVNSLTVESVSYDNEESLLKLRRHLLSERNIKLYPAIVLTFSKTISNDVIRLMGAIYNEDREAYIQQLI